MAKRDPNFPMQGKRGGMGGKYGSKSTNLSSKTLKAAGAKKAAGKRTVSISDTKRVGSKTMGPGGKPLTGTVDLGGGKTAVYKGGRRVQAADARKPKAKTVSSGSSSSSRTPSKATYTPPKKTGGKPEAPKVGTVRRGAAGRQMNRWDGKRWVPVAGTSAAGRDAEARRMAKAAANQRNDGSSSSSSSSSPMSKWNSLSASQKSAARQNVTSFAKFMGIKPTASVVAALGLSNTTVGKMVKGASQGTKPKGAFTPGAVAANKPKPSSGPKKGDRKTTMAGVAEWDGSKWVKVK